LVSVITEYKGNINSIEELVEKYFDKILKENKTEDEDKIVLLKDLKINDYMLE
jgi:dihydroxyacetone kinase